MVYLGKKPKMAKPTTSSSSPSNTTNVESSQFSSELSPESVDFSTTMAAKSVAATSVGTSATKVGAIVGVSAAVAATVLTTIIVTSVILSAPKSSISPAYQYLDYMDNCSNSSYSLCKTYLGLACVNNLCLCNSTTQYYNGSLCGKVSKINSEINRNKYLNFFLFKIVNQLTYNEPCNTSVSVKMCNYVTSGLACSNSSSTCQCSKTATFWSQNKNACGKL